MSFVKIRGDYRRPLWWLVVTIIIMWYYFWWILFCSFPWYSTHAFAQMPIPYLNLNWKHVTCYSRITCEPPLDHRTPTPSNSPTVWWWFTCSQPLPSVPAPTSPRAFPPVSKWNLLFPQTWATKLKMTCWVLAVRSKSAVSFVFLLFFS